MEAGDVIGASPTWAPCKAATTRPRVRTTGPSPCARAATIDSPGSYFERSRRRAGSYAMRLGTTSAPRAPRSAAATCLRTVATLQPSAALA